MTEPRFTPSRLSEIEHVEDYKTGGFHPIVVGDLFHERYRIIHKLGFGGSSTVWLARDQKHETGKLVTLKAMRADVSSKPLHIIPELVVPRALQNVSSEFRAIEDHFVVHGPNGSHQFIVSPLAGATVLAMSDSPGRTSGSRRLRGDLARKVSQELAVAIYAMHRSGWVHGDLTTSNILFRVSETVRSWSDTEVYTNLGPLETEEVRTRNSEPPGHHAPLALVAPIQNSRFLHSSLLQEHIMIIDFGQSYLASCPPEDYQPGTVLNYMSPEARFERRAGLEADVWALGCAIFEIRAGFPLFDAFFGSDTDILRQTVETLGRLPDPWWKSFEERILWFEEDGEPKSVEAQESAGVLLQSSKVSIRDKLRSIGTQDAVSFFEEDGMVEKSGVMLDESEVDLLGDLLNKMLVYRPEDRIGMREVVDHPWFRLLS